MPIVSVCIPVYNCEKFIGEAIDSVLAQSFGDFELIILNNCSTDKTAEVVGRYQDPRIRVIDQVNNIGAAGNWNSALRESNGKYVKLLCADDKLYPDCLALQVDCLESSENKRVIMASCRRDVIDENGRKVLVRGFSGASGVKDGSQAIRKALRSGGNLIGEVGSVLFRAEVLPLVGGFDEGAGYAIDLDFWCRMLLYGDIFFEEQPLCAYRVTRGSWSMQVADRQSIDFARLLKRMRDEPRSGMLQYDYIQGIIRAGLNRRLRGIFYKFFVGGK